MPTPPLTSLAPLAPLTLSAISTFDALKLLGFLAATVALVLVMNWRRRSHQTWVEETAGREVCEHLRPALDALRGRGYRVTRVGQVARDMPLEIHLAAGFDAQAVYDETGLAEPALVSDRNVLYCKEDWCELHPAK